MTEILAICVSLAVLAGGSAVIVKVWQVLRKLGHAVDDWQGEPARDGVPERPGVMRRLADIEAQLHPNGGGSLRDAIDGLTKGQKGLAEQLDEHVRNHHGD